MNLPPAPVLIVDDRPDNLLAVEAVLEPLNLDLVMANSGQEALKYLLTADVAVILLDVQMPGLDGYETARMIKARARTQNIPIIFLTARDRAIEHELAAYSSGAVDYLAKPFEPAVLRSKVQVFVDLYRQASTIEEQRSLLEHRLIERNLAEEALRRQAVELERSNAELERFAFVASNDLREPLQIVSGFLDLLKTRANRDADGLELTQLAISTVEGMSNLVDDLLTYSRASSGERRPVALELDAVLEDTLAQFGDRIDAGNIRVTHDPLPCVMGDRWQLGRLFWHLLDNAITFRRELDPEVHIGLSRRHDHWVVSFRDNGIGIDPMEVPRLFSLLGSDRTGQAAGTGVGLALCRRVVERHGGEIWIDSLPGRGSTVSFTLPVYDGQYEDEDPGTAQ